MATQEVKHTQLFINNEFVNAESGIKFPTYNPATEEELAQVHEAGDADVDKAVAAARKAFQIGSEWRTMGPTKRGQLMAALAGLMERDMMKLARLESLNCGKTFNEAIVSVYIFIATLKYYAGWTDKYFGKTIPVDGEFFTYTKHEPIGVCVGIVPWNYPLGMVGWKVGPALACGNTIVIKPSELTPLSALAICDLVVEAGFPAGVINIINGHGATTGSALSYHKDVNKIAFTGSVEVGRKVQEASAKSNLKRITLELGGKSPFIITEVNDDLLKRAAEDTDQGIFYNNGQTCFGCSRVFVHESVYDKYIEMLKKIAESKIVGDPLAPESTNGAIISKSQRDKILGYIEKGKKEGATVLTGGVKCGDKGYFIRPTIFTDVTDDMTIAKEEIFGPVVCVFKFKTIDEVIERANNTTYGLGAGLYSTDMNTTLKVSNQIESGNVWVNCYGKVFLQAPFGGFKQSGAGRELGEAALHEYTEVKTVTIRMD